MSALIRHDTKASFTSFKQKLFLDLAEKGFSTSGDIARRQIDDQIDMQVVVAGNDYYCFLTIQVLLPRAAAELRKRVISLSLPRRYDFDGQNIPIFSGDINHIGFHLPSEIREGFQSTDWGKLICSTDSLSHYLLHINRIEGVEFLSLFDKPSSLLLEQAAILAVFFQLTERQRIIMANGQIVDVDSFDELGIYKDLI